MKKKKMKNTQRNTSGTSRTYAYYPAYKPPAYKHINRSVFVPEPLSVSISPNIFAQIVAWTREKAPAETSGWGWIEDGEFLDIYQNSISVDNGNGTTEWSMAEIEAVTEWQGKPFPNLQWHSHPGFSAFYSGTDLNSNDKLLDYLMPSEEAGEVFILVQDGGMEWLMCQYMWQEYGNTLSHRNCLVNLLGVNMVALPRIKYTAGFNKKGKKNKTATDLALDGLFSDIPRRPEIPWKEKDGWRVLHPKEGAVLDHQFEDMPAGREINGQYIFFSTQDERAYMGDWSTIREDYDQLFDIFGVQKYNWEVLFDTIELEFPDSYYTIVSDPIVGWAMLKRYMEAKTK